MGQTLTLKANSMRQAMEWLENEAEDGDTIRLNWDGANSYSAQKVESKAMGLGLDVVVEVGTVSDLLPSVSHKEV